MREALESLKPHDHLCSIFSNQEEHFAVAIPFIQIGLECNEKCLYIADEHNLEPVRQRLHDAGVDVERAIERGALTLTTKEEAYMKRGHFDPDWMFTFWEAATQEALARGFSALRATGETEWVQRGGPGLERWMEYESRLTRVLEQSQCFTLCQYNRARCSPDVILNVIRTHPLIICGDRVCRNFYFVPSDEFLQENSGELQVERLLTNIRERDSLDEELRRAKDQLEARIRELQASNEKLAESEQRLQAHAKRLEQSNMELQQFAYLASHDLQEPLRMVAAFTQLLQKRYGDKLDQDGREFIAFAVDGAVRMQGLIQDLLAYSRVSTRGKEFRPVDANQIVERARASLKAAIDGTGAVVTAGELPAIVVDDVQIAEVFERLMSNAMKFQHPGARPVVRISAERKDGEYVFSVADNGIGIDPQHYERVFVIFQRLHTGQEYPGTGAGLALCKKIVERHGGRMWVESETGKGSIFHFTLPAARQNP